VLDNQRAARATVGLRYGLSALHAEDNFRNLQQGWPLVHGEAGGYVNSAP
jgi:hypothetical protein